MKCVASKKTLTDFEEKNVSVKWFLWARERNVIVLVLFRKVLHKNIVMGFV